MLPSCFGLAGNNNSAVIKLSLSVSFSCHLYAELSTGLVLVNAELLVNRALLVNAEFKRSKTRLISMGYSVLFETLILRQFLAQAAKATDVATTAANPSGSKANSSRSFRERRWLLDRKAG